MSTEQSGVSATGEALLTPKPGYVPDDRVIDFDIYNPPGLSEGMSLHESWKLLHKPGVPDVLWTPRNGGHWIFTRYDAMAKAYLDEALQAGAAYRFGNGSGPLHHFYRFWR